MARWTYSKAGVNIDRADLAKKAIAKILSGTHNKKVLQKIGHYCSVVDIGNGYGVAVTTDGVGTKLLVAQKLGKYDTVGIDCVAMNVNDLICLGAVPIAMVDYIAVRKINKEILKQIAIGLKKGAKQAETPIVGGETATLPDIIKGREYPFDLAGTAVGLIRKNKIISGAKIKPGDVLIGLKSNGIHSNGLTLARKALNLNSRQNCLELLKPTRIYVRPIMNLIQKVNVKGLAHMTGGGLTNLQRLNKKIGFAIENWPSIPKVFRQIQKGGNVSDFEMFRTFNMGIGFCVVVAKKDAGKTLKLLSAEKPAVLGKAVAGNRIIFEGKNLIYT